MRRTIAALGVAFLLPACSSESPAAPEPPASSTSSASEELPAVDIGTPVLFNDVSSTGEIEGAGELTLTTAEWVEGEQYVETYDHTWTPDHQWLVVWVEWSGDFGFNYLNLQWAPDSTGEGVLPPLGMGAFPPLIGEENEDAGNVARDVPREPGSVMVVDVFGSEYGGWVVE